MSDRYGGPERIRVARLVFAAAALAALIGAALLAALHPTAGDEATLQMVIGALVTLNMTTFRFLFGSGEEDR